MNLNKVFLIGRLTRDPELRSTPSGQQVASIGLATSRVWNDQASNSKREATEFHSIVAWGRLAEICNQYLRKGSLAMFEGRLQTRSWQDQSGNKRSSTEIVAENMQLGPRSSNPAGSSGGQRADAPTEPQPKQEQGKEPDIPVIQEDELTKSGKDEESKPIKDSDLPF